MNKQIILKILVLVILISCKKDDNYTKIKYYPNHELFKTNSNLFLIDSNGLSFGEISKLIDKKYYSDSLAYIKIKEDEIEHNILIMNTSFHAKRRSILSVSKDSILVDKGYNIKSLGYLMYRHYTNNGKNVRYPYNSKIAYIELALNEESRDVEKLLLRIIKTFDSINNKTKDSLELKILLKRKMPPPPPPPPKETN